jgi:putative glycosyltransferase (TIGR04348 family)
MSSSPATVAIITPSLAEANNGNWRTARRWQQLLSPIYKTIVLGDWADEAPPPAVFIALHARRSATIVRRFRQSHPATPIVVVLTGTDLYHDLASSQDALESLRLADALVVLQDDAIQYLPHEYRNKSHVVYQSAKPLKPAVKYRGRLDCVVVGHLRREKDPGTVFKAVRELESDPRIHFLHIGKPLDAELARQAETLTKSSNCYHWAGAMSHGLTRAAIKRAHVLIHPSIMEGGANVIVEAISSGTPVVASHISGNIGMMGPDYQGYFPVGDHLALASILRQLVQDPNLLTRLNLACKARAKLFLPSAEQGALLKILSGLKTASD